MYEEEKQRLVENVVWFEQFFNDVNQLGNRIFSVLSATYSMKNTRKYNIGSNQSLYMPGYQGLYLGNDYLAINIYMIFNPSSLLTKTPFKQEPSIVIIMHSMGDFYYAEEKVSHLILKNDGVKFYERTPEQISGEILTGEAMGAKFFAFQIPWDPFIDNLSPTNAIRTEIVDRLDELPDF